MAAVAVVAATDTPAATPIRGALQALTAAALLLPGMLANPARAAEANTLSLQASRYEEGQRDLGNGDSGLQPLYADSLHASGTFMLRDSIRLAFGLAQDTWSGATPVAVAPLAANSNRPILKNAAQGVVVSGASPIVNTRLPLEIALAPGNDSRNVLIMSSASPELRQQADIALDVPVEPLRRTGALTLGAGISDEPDYFSRYGRIGGRVDFDQRLATLDVGASFTRSSTSALLDADLLPYLTRSAYIGQLQRSDDSELLRGERRDRSFDLGFTRILDATSILDLDANFTHSRGFMENPYKATTVVFADPARPGASGDVRALLEQRPDARRQRALHAHYARHFTGAAATLQLDYLYSTDDWGIEANSIELGWAQTLAAWTLTPRLRYYTQGAADFHTSWLVSRQPYRSAVIDPANPGLPPRFNTFSPSLLPAYFSSDHRLAAFSSLSAGLTVQRHFAAGFTLEAGVEYYKRAGDLQAGSGPDSAYADFDFVTANVALTVDLQATPRRLRREQAATAVHAGHAQHATHPAPAGVMFAHAAAPQGSVMNGYRVNHARQYGALLHNMDYAPDSAAIIDGCSTGAHCRHAPAAMTMTMHMFDLMYAVSDSVTLMLMPQFMTMDMTLRDLAGRSAPLPGPHEHGGDTHASGAVGDTLVAGLFDLRTTPTQTLHTSLGVSVPTGKVDLQYRRQFQNDGGLMHYDMQTGSGTWDLWPALTWTGSGSAWHWGAQLGGIVRLENRNNSGYRLGNQMHVSAWATHTLVYGLSASIRAVFTQNGSIDGTFTAYNQASGPMDFPGNHGGRSGDLGIGVNYSIAGSELALEWLAPVHDDVHGFQLQRQGILAASWQYNY